MSARLPPRYWVLVVGLCAFCWLGVTAPAAAQKVKVSFRGTEMFSNQLHEFGLEPLHRVSDLAVVDPKDTLVVVFGDPKALDALNEIQGGLANFQARGGALLLALDRNDGGRLKGFRVKVGAKEVWYECHPEDPQFAYRNDLRFIFIKTFISIHHPVLLGLNKGLATNHPCSLELESDCNFQGLCAFPDGWFRTLNSGPKAWQVDQILGGGKTPFIAGTASNSGPHDRVVIIPGHGLFMNGLMAQNDNDNMAFANNCIRWLTNMEQRKKVLFIVDNQVVTKLELPLGQPPMPPVFLMNQLLHAIEEENLFNRILLNFIREDQLLRWEVGIGSVILLVLVVSSLVRHRLPLALGPLLRRRVSTLYEQPPLIVQRHRAVLRHGNLWEAAHVLARQCFEGAALRPPPTRPQAVRGDAEQRRLLESLVQHLWQLAYGPTARPILLPEFARLLQSLEQVRAALADGTLLYEG